MKVQINSAIQMEALGGTLARELNKTQNVICLEGELGAGKTTLVRGFLRELGYAGTVKSPTYTIVESYIVQGHKIYHFDLYRVSSFEELEDMGFADYFDEDACCLIEWPGIAEAYLPPQHKYCTIEITATGRDVVIR